MYKQANILTMFFIAIHFSACTYEKPNAVSVAPLPPSTVGPQIQQTVENVLPTLSQSPTAEPEIQQAVVNTSVPTLLNISNSSWIFNTWWSLDSKTLFYGVPEQNLAYDIMSGQVDKITVDEIYQLTPEYLLASQLPPEATRIFVSPSGQRALYFKIITPIPTRPTDPASQGEDTIRGIMAELWLQDMSGNTSNLGVLEFCGFSDALWAHDEDKAVIPRSVGIGRCGDTAIWLVDLQNGNLSPLVLLDDYPTKEIRTYSNSPDGQRVIYSTWGRNENDELANPLFILDLVTLRSTPLQTPVLAHLEQWLTEQEILISYTNSPGEGYLSLGVFHLETSELIELTPTFEDSCIRYPTISPDLQWLAFATAKDNPEACSLLDNLWLLKLDISN